MGIISDGLLIFGINFDVDNEGGASVKYDKQGNMVNCND